MPETPQKETIFDVSSEAELAAVASEIVRNKPGVILFQGELGAGKTTLVKACCTLLGSTDEVTSPTFSLVNEYRTTNGASIYHIDLYRLQNMDEAIRIGIEDYLHSGTWCFIEWPELIRPLLNDLEISQVMINVSDDGERRITILN